MPPPTQTDQTLSSGQPDQNQQSSQEPENLVSRVSSFQLPQSQQTQQPDETFDPNEINNVKTVEKAVEWAKKAQKSWERGYNKKFQDLAAMRKDYESKTFEFSNWSPDKIRRLLQDENFVKSAQEVTSTEQTEGDFSDEGRQQLSTVQHQIQQLKRQNLDFQNRQQDEMLTKKYKDYDPEMVNAVTQKLLSGEVQATREDLWKVTNYEKDIQRAYQLGLTDRKLELNDKISSTSTDGYALSPTSQTVEQEKNESDENYFKRIALGNLVKFKQSGR